MANTTDGIIRAFIDGATKGKASSLEIQGDRLFNYATCIAQRVDGMFIVNVSKHSATTSKHQNRFLQYAPCNNVITVSGLELGTQQLY